MLLMKIKEIKTAKYKHKIDFKNPRTTRNLRCVGPHGAPPREVPSKIENRYHFDGGGGGGGGRRACDPGGHGVGSLRPIDVSSQ